LTVIREVVVCTGLGVTIGTTIAVGVARMLRSLVYRAGAGDWLFQLVVALALMVSATALSYWSGRRAGSAQPTQLLGDI
jgi:hypothetical protein